MQKLESIFEKDSGFDHKNITNKSENVVPEKFLNAIENGVTSEELEDFTRAGLKIFKYKTQITVHGIFGELQKHYIGGYKNLFQNKNLSIGIRYGAIDESKRQRIAEKIRYAGFRYQRNSTDHRFEVVKSVTKENFETVKAFMFGLKSKIDTSLFTGGVYLFKGSAFGMTYLCLEVHVSIIPEGNVDKFWQCLVSQETIDAKLEERRIADEQYRTQQQKAMNDAKATHEATMLSAKDDIDYLEKHFPKVGKTDEPGIYLKVDTDGQGQITFDVKCIYKPRGAKFPRHNDTSYKTMELALKHTLEARSWDSIYKGKVSERYRIDAPAPSARTGGTKKAPLETVNADGLSLVRYSEKCFAVIGETKPIKETLARLGCKFNGHLNIGGEKKAGWLVWGNILDKVANALQLSIPA